MAAEESVEELKRKAAEAVEAAKAELVALSLDIQARPEVGYQEFQAADWVATSLERHGFEVTRGVGGLDTALLAECGSLQLYQNAVCT